MATLFPPNLPPIINQPYSFRIALTSQGDTDVFQTSVTLAAGDVKVSGNSGTFSNITNLPTEIGTTGILNVLLTAAEMNYGSVNVLFHDAAGSQWQDAFVMIETTTAAQDIADAVWDETANGHNVPNSYGRRLRQLASSIITDGSVVSATINTVTLDSGASTADGSYDPSIIVVTNPVDEMAQARLIFQYVGSTKTATIDRDWKVIPDNTYTYTILAHPGREHVNEGKPQAVTNGTITLNANASSTNNAYVGQTIFIRSGTGEDQVRTVTSYDGTTKIATIDENWDINPDTNSGYVMLPTLFGHVTTAHLGMDALQQFFLDDTTLQWGNAVDGSIVKEIFDGIPPTTVGAAAIWSYATRTLTQTLSQIIQAVKGGTLSFYRGDTNEINLVIGDISDYQQLDIFLKNDPEDRDDRAILWVRKNITGSSDGLKALWNYEVDGGIINAGWANIVVNDAATGNISLTVEAEASQYLQPDVELWYDIQKISPTKVKTVRRGFAEVEADIGHTIT